MKCFSNKTLIFFFRKFWGSYISDLAKSVLALRILSHISTRNFGKKALNSGEPCNCEYVTLLQSFYRDNLSIHWFIAYLLHVCII